MALQPTLNYRSNLLGAGGQPAPGTPLVQTVTAGVGIYSNGETVFAPGYGDISTVSNVYGRDAGTTNSFTLKQSQNFAASSIPDIYTNTISDPRITSGLYRTGGPANTFAPAAQKSLYSSGTIHVTTQPEWDGPYLTSSFDMLGNKTSRTFGNDYPYNYADYTFKSSSASDFFRKVTSNNVAFDVDSGLGGSASISGPLFSFRPTFGRLASFR